MKKVTQRFAIAVRRSRLACGLSQENLAARVDLSRRTVQRVEAGVVDVALGDALRIAHALNISIDTLVPRSRSKAA